MEALSPDHVARHVHVTLAPADFDRLKGMLKRERRQLSATVRGWIVDELERQEAKREPRAESLTA